MLFNGCGSSQDTYFIALQFKLVLDRLSPLNSSSIENSTLRNFISTPNIPLATIHLNNLLKTPLKGSIASWNYASVSSMVRTDMEVKILHVWFALRAYVPYQSAIRWIVGLCPHIPTASLGSYKSIVKNVFGQMPTKKRSYWNKRVWVIWGSSQNEQSLESRLVIRERMSVQYINQLGWTKQDAS